MRVLNVIHDARFGGPHRRVGDLAPCLKRRDVASELCLPLGEGNGECIARQKGIAVHRVKFSKPPRPSQIGAVFAWLVRFPGDVWRLARFLKAERPDVVHLNGALLLQFGVAAWMSGTPLVWLLNDTIVPKPFSHILGRVVSLLANRVVAEAHAVARHYGVRPGAYELIYAPVDQNRFDANKPKESAEMATTLRIGLIGNWNPIKGHDLFAQALADVRRRLGRPVRIIFAGQKLTNQQDYIDQVERLIADLNLDDCIEDHGFVPEPSSVTASLDILVLSSRSEACPIVVLEAMAAGVPVVAFDVGGVREQIDRGPTERAGLVCERENIQQMSDSIVRISQDAALARQLGEAGRRVAGQVFSLDTAADRHVAVYRGALQSAKRLPSAAPSSNA